MSQGALDTPPRAASPQTIGFLAPGQMPHIHAMGGGGGGGSNRSPSPLSFTGTGGIRAHSPSLLSSGGGARSRSQSPQFEGGAAGAAPWKHADPFNNVLSRLLTEQLNDPTPSEPPAASAGGASSELSRSGRPPRARKATRTSSQEDAAAPTDRGNSPARLQEGRQSNEREGTKDSSVMSSDGAADAHMTNAPSSNVEPPSLGSERDSNSVESSHGSADDSVISYSLKIVTEQSDAAPSPQHGAVDQGGNESRPPPETALLPALSTPSGISTKEWTRMYERASSLTAKGRVWADLLRKYEQLSRRVQELEASATMQPRDALSQPSTEPTIPVAPPVVPSSPSSSSSSSAQAAWQAEQQRLDSKVRFLEGVIKSKDDKIDNLQMRVDDLRNERDSYKDAMVKIFEENHPGSGGSPTATATPTTAAAAAKSAIGIIGTIGSSYLRKASSGGGGVNDELDQGGSSHGNSAATAALKEQIRELTKQVLELKHLEKAKDKVEELERRAAEAEMHTQKAQEFCLQEVNAVNGRLQLLQLKYNEAVTEKEQAEAELAKLRKQWSKDSRAQTAVASEAAELRSQLDAARAKLSEAESRLIDPIVVSKLEEKMHEVTAEKSHWQKKAQSLSKDMQRVLGSAAEAEQLRAKVAELQSRNEELEAERDMFRQTMVAAIAESAVTQDQQYGASSSSGGGGGAGGGAGGGVGSRAAELAASIGGRLSAWRRTTRL